MNKSGIWTQKGVQHEMDDMHKVVVQKMIDLYHMLVSHNGFGEMSVEIRILKRSQKEVIIRCGKQYRYVVDKPGSRPSNTDWLLDWKPDEDATFCPKNKHPTPEVGADKSEKIAP